MSPRILCIAALLLLSCAGEAEETADPSWRSCEIALPGDPPEEADSWYVCVDSRILEREGCGPDGYLLGFGGKYAEKYMVEVRPSLGPAGQDFLDGVLVCLQEHLKGEMADEPTCESIATLGFAAHVPCYEESGFCELPLDDVVLIAAAVEPEDQGLPEQQAAVAAIGEACGGR